MRRYWLRMIRASWPLRLISTATVMMLMILLFVRLCAEAADSCD